MNGPNVVHIHNGIPLNYINTGNLVIHNSVDVSGCTVVSVITTESQIPQDLIHMHSVKKKKKKSFPL